MVFRLTKFNFAKKRRFAGNAAATSCEGAAKHSVLSARSDRIFLISIDLAIFRRVIIAEIGWGLWRGSAAMWILEPVTPVCIFSCLFLFAYLSADLRIYLRLYLCVFLGGERVCMLYWMCCTLPLQVFSVSLYHLLQLFHIPCSFFFTGTFS